MLRSLPLEGPWLVGVRDPVWLSMVPPMDRPIMVDDMGSEAFMVPCQCSQADIQSCVAIRTPAEWTGLCALSLRTGLQRGRELQQYAALQLSGSLSLFKSPCPCQRVEGVHPSWQSGPAERHAICNLATAKRLAAASGAVSRRAIQAALAGG